LGVQLLNHRLVLPVLLRLAYLLGYHAAAELVSILTGPLLGLEIDQVARGKVHVRDVSTGSHVRRRLLSIYSLILRSLIEDDLSLPEVLGTRTIHAPCLWLLAYLDMWQLLLLLQSILKDLLASHDLLSVLDIAISLPTKLLLEADHVALGRSLGF